MAKLRLDPNLPVVLDVKYADLIDSQYGVQLRLKGATTADRDAVLYVDLAHADEALRAAGVIDAPFDVPATLPERGLDVKHQLRATKLTVAKEQRTGEKSGRFVVRAPSGTSPTPTPERKGTGAVYLECVDFVLEKVLPRFAKYDRSVSDEAIASMTATLFIQRMKER